MATTINQGFQILRQNLEITDLQAGTVSTRHTNVRAAVEDEMTVLETFLTGSYKRSTMIAPLKDADIDVFVVLDPSYYKPDGQASLLDKVKRVLKKEYPKSPRISRNGQAVTITFTDFQVDVVPGFRRQGGGFLIPDSIKGRWIGTNPRKHVEIWSVHNKTHNGSLVPVLKMLKGWNVKHSSTFRSFHLEVTALNVFQGVNIHTYPSGVRHFFDKARNQYSFQYDPAGYGGNVADYLDSQAKRDAVKQRLQAAYEKAIKAEQFARDGYIESAFKQWQIIFGSYFPAYG
ncbi:CBASS oligonucleotide cyclase [Candidatus Laterigemmans baculatus]|uniref:CBASS oligonucleotide cyclase n=1 Tax=Candidatus Laterigemmans baculatus TaxID=2770505 RepID=UPI0013DB63DA|nr:CBASS oligonucleotide cyclase [Candidatus Laterigemmans baculatus]